MRLEYEMLTDLYQLTMAQGYWAADKIADDVIRNYSANLSAIVFDDYKKEVVKYGR